MTGALWKCQRASLNDNDCEQGMNPDKAAAGRIARWETHV